MSDDRAGHNGGKSIRWPAIIIGLLAVHTAGMVLVVLIATRDPSFAVVPDYYRKSLAWDQEKAKRAKSEALGWTAQITPAETTDLLGRRDVGVRLTDNQGRPVAGAIVQIKGYHRARAADVQAAEAVSDEQGQAVMKMTMRTGGFWRIDISARRGEDEFIDARDVAVPSVEKRTP